VEKKFKGCAPNEGWFILTNFGDLPTAIKAIENALTLKKCSDFKSGGYNLEEDTNVSGPRLISLILVIAFAYSSATFKGQKIRKKEHRNMSAESENGSMSPFLG